MPVIGQGSVILVELMDPQGRNPKVRPAIVVTEDRTIQAGGPINVVAVTSSVTLPLSETHVELPWNASGSAGSGLKKRSVAVCDWLLPIERTQIERVIGHLPSPITLQILSRLPL